MSNIYIQEPPTHGKVCLETSVGDIEIELLSRECPKACKNFVQLCMENYYNKTKFHRVVKEFVVQGGDPGNGGESIYGQPFKDEFHSRLRFVRRGLVAMANAGKDDNGSQFFFTMGPTQELQNKHTIFGKVVGDTIYNMVKLQEGEVDEESERPTYPNKILRTRVISNPFPDIVPRETIQMIKDEDESSQQNKKKKSKMKATKDFNLISFGDEAEEEENDLAVVHKSYKSKSKSSHDLLNDPKLSAEVGTNKEIEGYNGAEVNSDDESEPESKKIKSNEEIDISSIRSKLQKTKTKKGHEHTSLKLKHEEDLTEGEQELDVQKRKREEIKREIMELQREMKGIKNKKAKEQSQTEHSDCDPKIEQIEKNDMLVSFHKEQEKYATKKVSKKGKSREDQTMALLAKFKAKLGPTHEIEKESNMKNIEDEEDDLTGDSWMHKKLKFESEDPVLAKDANTKDDDWFDIYDPRNPLNKRRREKKKT